MWYSDIVLIARPTKNGESSTGQPIIVETTIIEALKCNVQNGGNELLMNDAGQTVIAKYKIFCPITSDVKERDYVYYAGEKYRVLRVSEYRKVMPHIELAVEGGVF